MAKKQIPILLVFIILITAGSILFWKTQDKNRTKTDRIKTATGSLKTFSDPVAVDLKKNDYDSLGLPLHYSYFSDKDFYDEAYQFGESQVKKPEGKVYGGIIPHHLLVKDKLGAYFQGLEEQIKLASESQKTFSGSDADNNYETIVLIGPNHFSQGKADIILSKAQWETPHGKVNPDLDLINEINQLPGADVEEEPFIKEHSISGPIGFISKSFSNAKIVPIILNFRASSTEMLNLGKAIYQNVDPEKTLVLASVDFSHYLPAEAADFHDLKSNAIIQDFDFNEIYNSEIDSPQAITALLEYLKLVGAKNSDLIFHTNSGTLMGALDEPSTSHNFYYFYKPSPRDSRNMEVKKSPPLSGGEKGEVSDINLLFFGDMMLDRNVKTYINKNSLDYLFTNVAGQNNNFFKGIDIVGANLEGAVTNNGEHYPPNNRFDFAFDPNLIKEIKKFNFNYFNLANNHFSDQGQNGMDQTRKYLDELNINYAGCADRQVAECSSKIINVNGQPVGMAGFSMVYGSLPEEKVLQTVRGLASSTDLVVVNIHWGVEYQHQFNKTQQELAHKMIDAGADIIIGHHPHVVQGVEIYNNKPIFYSLGNFIFDQYFSADTQEELAMGININKQQQTYFLFPLSSKASQPTLMKGTEKEKFLNNFVKWSKIDKNYIEEILKTQRFILNK